MSSTKKVAARKTKAGTAAPKKPKTMPTGELPLVSFAQPSAWSDWLASHHAASRGVWLKLAKKASGVASITYPEALEVALAWGWIDGQKKSHDERSWLQKFTP
ncbi:MAG: YdeI/OmpD-associated family protein, partial [Archangium sp.]